MKKRTIAIDCDDVIVETAPLIINHYNKTYGTTLKLTDFYGADLTPWQAPDDATAIKRVDDFLVSDEYINAAPLAEAVNTINKLYKQYELHIVTGRPDFVAEATKDMLARRFPNVFASIAFTNMFNATKARPKADVCKELSADLLIDDHLKHARQVAAAGIDVLLFGNYPWNRTDDLPKNIRRVRGWAEVCELLL